MLGPAARWDGTWPMVLGTMRIFPIARLGPSRGECCWHRAGLGDQACLQARAARVGTVVSMVGVLAAVTAAVVACRLRWRPCQRRRPIGLQRGTSAECAGRRLLPRRRLWELGRPALHRGRQPRTARATGVRVPQGDEEPVRPLPHGPEPIDGLDHRHLQNVPRARVAQSAGSMIGPAARFSCRWRCPRRRPTTWSTCVGTSRTGTPVPAH